MNPPYMCPAATEAARCLTSSNAILEMGYMPCIVSIQCRNRKYRMPAPSTRALMAKDWVPLWMVLPSPSRTAHPVTVARSRQRMLLT